MRLPVLFTLTLSAACTDLPARPLVTCDIAIVGTSLTAGYGLSNPERDAWPAALTTAIETPHETHILGIPGATAASWEPILAKRLQALKPEPSWVIIEIGANEMLRGTPGGRVRPNLPQGP